MKKEICPNCGKTAHDFANEEVLNCVPPFDVLIFGEYQIDRSYRMKLYQEYPMYTVEEVVGTYLGHNPNYPNQRDWLEEQENGGDQIPE